MSTVPVTNWTPLRQLGERKWLSAATERRRVELNKRVAEMLKKRQQHDANRQKLSAADLSSVSSEQLFQADCPAENHFRLLQEELNLRGGRSCLL